MMNKYRVYASYVVELYVDVEAESIDEAYDKAYNIDGNDYTRTENNGDWQIDRIEEVV
jgi:hypothetical protein